MENKAIDFIRLGARWVNPRAGRAGRGRSRTGSRFELAFDAAGPAVLPARIEIKNRLPDVVEGLLVLLAGEIAVLVELGVTP